MWKIYCIILAVKHRNNKYLKRTHKFGFEVPKIVAFAIALDENICCTLWKEAISKEMKIVRAELKILAEGGKHPSGNQEILCHVMFDMNMGDFRNKARLVSGGYVAEPPDTITYASVALRETVHVVLTVVDLNDFQVRKADIYNSYIQAPVAKKILSVSSEAIITKH